MLRLLLLSFFFSSISLANGQVPQYEIPRPDGVKVPSDPELQNLVWNKWDTQNFTILSLDESQGKYLYENIEQMKRWVLTRWGLPDVQFQAECRILCVPNKSLMKKLFRLEKSHGEVRRENGRISMTVLWLILDESPAATVPPALTKVCLAELERQLNIEWWARRGMAVLNQTFPQIYGDLSAIQPFLNRNQPILSTEKILSTNKKEWRELSSEQQLLFDRQSAALLLLIRKEFGQSNLLRFLSTDGSEQQVEKILGFQSYSEFTETFFRYLSHLVNDVAQDKAPKSYLQISPPAQ